MHFYNVEKLKLIVGWNPKVACTTVKILILKKLGHEIVGNVHLDMLAKGNLQSGRYDIYKLSNPKFKNINLNDYTKICIVRNPYERLISGIRQRSRKLCDFNIFGDLSENTISMFLQNLKNHNYLEHHFYPQVKDMNDFKFDHIIDIKDMSKLYSILELEHTNDELGGQITKYYNDNDNDYHNYHYLTIKDISNRFHNKWSRNIYSWFTKNDIELINELYEKDFIFLEENGFDYKIKNVSNNIS